MALMLIGYPLYVVLAFFGYGMVVVYIGFKGDVSLGLERLRAARSPSAFCSRGIHLKFTFSLRVRIKACRLSSSTSKWGDEHFQIEQQQLIT